MAKLRLIQCGVGGFGGVWIKNHVNNPEDFELSALVDVSEKALGEAGQATGVPAERRFTSLEAALAKVEADAVLTATPPAVHVEHARLAFSRGLHLMTEKPIAADLPQAREMVELAAKAGRQLVVSQNYRFGPAMHTLRRLVSAAPLGPVGHGHIDFYIPADFTGSFRESMAHVLLVDMAVHHLDLLRAVAARNIVRVSARTFRPEWSWYRHNPGLKMILELDGGQIWSYSGDWSARGRNTDWSGSWRVQCAEGSLGHELGKVTLWRSSRGFTNDTASEEAAIEKPARLAQAATLHLFAEAIRTGVPAEISGADNLWTFGAVMAGVKSAESDGAWVDVKALISG